MNELTYQDIQCLSEINETETDKVESLIASMLENGWQGAPILVIDGFGLLTGSHRMAALKTIANRDGNGEYDDDDDLSTRVYELLNETDLALDVTDLVNDAFAAYEEENGETPDLEFDSIGWMFEGTEVEEWKNEIAEW